MSNSEKTFYNLTEVSEILVESVKSMKSLNERLKVIEKKLGVKEETEHFKLQVGKWYKYPYYENWKLCVTSIDGNEVMGNGVDLNGFWVSYGIWDVIEDELDKLIECTPQEVKESLESEAKRRYKVGDKIRLIRRNVDGKYKNEIHLTDFSYETDNQLYCDGNLLIFDDGEWAEVIEQPTDKFAELKEAHRKGAVIQYKNWTTKYFLDCPDNLPKWNESTEYRIKPQQPTLEQDIQQLKDKYKQYKFTITIEDNI